MTVEAVRFPVSPNEPRSFSSYGPGGKPVYNAPRENTWHAVETVDVYGEGYVEFIVCRNERVWDSCDRGLWAEQSNRCRNCEKALQRSASRR